MSLLLKLDCDPDGCSYGCDLEDVYDIDDGGIVSGLDVVPDSMHRASQRFDDSAKESDVYKRQKGKLLRLYSDYKKKMR